jgi:hypothetical protein
MSTSAFEVNRGSTSRLATLPVGGLSANMTALIDAADGFLGATVVETTAGAPSAALVFVDFEEQGSQFPARPTSYSSEVLTPTATVEPGGGRNSAFITGTNGLSDYLLLVGNFHLAAR